MRFFVHYLGLLILWVLSFFDKLVLWWLLFLNDVFEPCAAAQGWFDKLLGWHKSQMALSNQFNMFFQNVNSRNTSIDGIV